MPSSLPRRALLLSGLGIAATAAGCRFDDPTVQPRGGAATQQASATPTPDAALVAARSDEASMAAWCSGLPLVQSAGTIPAASVPVLAAVRDAHRAHAAVLAQPDPLVPSAASPSPSAAAAAKVSGTWAAMQSQLAAREKTLAAHQRAAALAATHPARALLHASLMAFATGAPAATVAPVRGQVEPADVEVGTRLDALGVLLSTLRALAQGIQIGAGQLPLPSDYYEPALARLKVVWTQRDQTEAAIRAAKGTVPTAPASYRMPGGFATPRQVRATWGALETSTLNAWGRLAAASTGQDRATALDAMAAQVTAVQATGVALSWWPGWA